MQDFIFKMQPYLPYLLPPIIGAFIGYLTNRIAIRMLFRPLKKWKILGIGIPMTPGVIPSKRRELAENMGEMVGQHLLTSEEVGKAVETEQFQRQLSQIIQTKAEQLLEKDLPSIAKIVPNQYGTYFTVACSTVKYKLNQMVGQFVYSESFSEAVSESIEKHLYSQLELPVNTVLTDQNKAEIYKFIDTKMSLLMNNGDTSVLIQDFLKHKIFSTLQQNKSLDQVLPSSLINVLHKLLEQQTQPLLKNAGKLASEPDIKAKIVGGVKNGIDSFIASLGPMGSMASSFLTAEIIEQKVGQYIDDNEESLEHFMCDPKLEKRVSFIIKEKFNIFLSTPLTEIVTDQELANIDIFCREIGDKAFNLLQNDDFKDLITNIIKGQLDDYSTNHNNTIGSLAVELVGKDQLNSHIGSIAQQILLFIRNDENKKMLELMTGGIIDNFVNHPVGKLSRLIPQGVSKGVCASLQTYISSVLVQEIPGIVKSLRISNIVEDKINSFDLLRLEKLLLSIMEEQFKYINLFGAILGFLIGCLNVVALLFI